MIFIIDKIGGCFVMKKRQTRATKIVLAALLAVNMIVPGYSAVAYAEQGTTTVIAADQLADGTYDIAFKTLKINEDVASGMDNRFAKTAKLIVKNGKMTVQMNIIAQNEMIEKLQIKRNNTFIDVDVLEGSKDTTARAIAFAVDDLHAITVAHVFVNLFGTIVEQDFRIQFIAPQDGITENIGVTAYKYGTSEQSAIQQHIAPLAQVTKTANGTVVAITFQEGQMIQSFTVEGSKTTLQEKSVGQTTSTYTFPVEDLKQLVTATVKIAAGSYSAEYPLQFRFDVKGAPTIVENPFTDIETDGNKDAILTLYAKGIITKAEHFYPQNNVTRGQLALMIARALQLSDAPDAGFKDVVTLSDTEQIQAINALAAAGIVMTGENFKPNDIITRQQGALMVYRAISYVAQKELDFGSTLVYADEASISNVEARKAFALLYAGGMMTGRKNTAGALVIEPNTQLKRTQMAKILNGALKYMSTK